jgi:hypothetical protein
LNLKQTKTEPIFSGEYQSKITLTIGMVSLLTSEQSLHDKLIVATVDKYFLSLMGLKFHYYVTASSLLVSD